MWPTFILWLVVGTVPPGPPARPLLVSAAISLTEVLTECGAAFTASSGVPVRFNFGASNALARQIVQGAPVDVFVSADAAQMQVAVRAGAMAPGHSTVVATNDLVVVIPAGSGGAWTSPSPLASPDVARVATGDPTAVPAGVYAKQWLERVGLWSAVQRKLVPTASVRGALAAVRSGAADAAIVYRTDARSPSGIDVAFEVSGPHAPAIEYPAGVVAHSALEGDARRFVEFLSGPAGQRIFTRWGFGSPGVSKSK